MDFMCFIFRYSKKKLPEIKEKNTVVTKGRFGYNIPSDKSLYDEGKRIMLLSILFCLDLYYYYFRLSGIVLG